jgi:hypothetical protein
MNKICSQPNLTWDFYSGLSGPSFTILGCLVILFIKYTDMPLCYFFPIFILIFSSCLVLIFWFGIFYYTNRRISWLVMIRVGRWCQRLIIGSQVLLIIMTILQVLPILTLKLQFDFPVDNLYWILTGWAWLETTHHAVYKLLFGKKNALFEMEISTIEDLQKPIGGALGAMLRKMDQ